MRAFLQEIREIFSTSLNDLLCWIFFPKREACLVQGVRFDLLDEEARQQEQTRRLYAAYNNF